MNKTQNFESFIIWFFSSSKKGYQNEGWVDPRKYLLAVRSKSKFLGTDFVNGMFLNKLLYLGSLKFWNKNNFKISN